MASNEHGTAPADGAPAPGLPPVTPPSGRFIAQLFLVPGMIVLVAVLIILGINYLFIGGYTPEYFLSKLDSDNTDIRWRGASDLAQHIKRQESKVLKADAGFALHLADRLHRALDELRQDEQSLGAKLAREPAAEHDKAWQKLAKKSDYVEYLAAALGDFYAPVGAPLLCDIITQEVSPNKKGNTMRRRRAIWALANLGHHVKSIEVELSSEQRATIVDGLRQAIADNQPHRKAWAQTGLYYVDKSRLSETADVVRVDHALAQASRSEDRYLREHVAMALNFWEGDQVEETLLRLARDDGFGTLMRIGEAD